MRNSYRPACFNLLLEQRNNRPIASKHIAKSYCYKLCLRSLSLWKLHVFLILNIIRYHTKYIYILIVFTANAIQTVSFPQTINSHMVHRIRHNLPIYCFIDMRM